MLVKKKKLRNKFEKRIDRQLNKLCKELNRESEALGRKAKVRYDYETEKLPYVIAAHYIPDFIITTASGDKIYIECKGYLRPEDKRKLVAVKKCYPTYDIRILFYRMVLSSIKWAERHNFPYAVDILPGEWIGNC